MIPGTLFVDAHARPWLVLSVAGAMAAIAPVVPATPSYAGDVPLRAGSCVRASAAVLAVPRGQPIARVEAAILDAAVLAAERVTATARVVRRFAPLAQAARARA